MSSGESINVGFQALNRPERLPAERTILVVALPRGGSSFIASTLANLGVPFGQPPPNYDDGELFGAIYDKNWQAVRRRVDEMNARHFIWGAKMMGPAAHLPDAIQLTRNPMVICVFRDAYAVALRKQMVGKEAYERVQRGIAKTVSDYRKLAGALRSLPEHIPIMLVSYGNAMQHPAAFVRGVNDFIGRPFTALPLDQADEIAADVLNQGGRYRRAKARKIERAKSQKSEEEAEARREERARARKAARKNARKAEEARAARAAEAARAAQEGKEAAEAAEARREERVRARKAARNKARKAEEARAVREAEAARVAEEAKEATEAAEALRQQRYEARREKRRAMRG